MEMEMEMEMETEKRKRSDDDGEAEGRRTRVKGDESDLKVEQTPTATVTEEEVEEFYAIVRRVHEVMRYFGKGEGGAPKKKKKKKNKGELWKPSFQWEDFEEVNVHKLNKGSREKEKIRDAEAVEENQVVPVALDLNSVPEPEPETVPERI